MSYLPHASGKPFLQASAEELRAEAAKCYGRSEESFQRCDTDGFLSQWVGQITAQQLTRQAEIAERGGVSDFLVLIETATGRVVSRRELPGRWQGGIYMKPVWTLSREDQERLGRRFIPTGERSRIQKQLGLHEGTEAAPAMAIVGGSGTGLSGCANAHVIVIRRTDHA